MSTKFLAVLIFLTNFKLCQCIKYTNYTLIKILPVEHEHLKFLQNLDSQKYIDFQFWTKSYKLYYEVHMIINPADMNLFIERANHFKLQFEVLQFDIQEAFDQQHIQTYIRLRPESFSFSHYHTLDDIYQWMTDIFHENPETTQLEIIGRSAEGREILCLSINKNDAKKIAVVEGGMHGHEWITTSFVCYLINNLVHSRNNPLIYHLADKYHWYLIPVVNPDGFEYTHKSDRLWRKNRRNHGNGVGIDLNRNFDHSHGKFSSSKDPKDDNYCGPEPLSEPETKAFAAYIANLGEDIKFYFSIHAYGQKIILPYDDRINHVENFSEMENYGRQAVVKMYRMNKTKYAIGTTYDRLGVRKSGTSASWVKNRIQKHVPYVFTFLLQDNGTYGHALPSSRILPACQEGLIGLTEIMTAKPKYVRMLYDSHACRNELNMYIVMFSVVVIFNKVV